jgi:hypothetical protein
MFLKNFFPNKKSPIGFIYENLYGTVIGPREEIEYYLLCLREIVNIIGSHYIKKFFGGKK